MGLILDVLGLRTQRWLMAIPVVTAEEQINPRGKHHAHVRLGIATVATIVGTEGWRGQGGRHWESPLLSNSLPLPGVDQAATPGWFTKGERLQPVIVRQCPQPPGNLPRRLEVRPNPPEGLAVGRKVLG